MRAITATLHNRLALSSERLIIAAPPTVQISGRGLSPAGQDQGFNVYMRDNVAANAPVDITVSGTAPMPSATQGGGTGEAIQRCRVRRRFAESVRQFARRCSSADAPAATATTVPARLDSLKWILVAGFAAIFVLGFVYLWLRPEMPPPPTARGPPKPTFRLRAAAKKSAATRRSGLHAAPRRSRSSQRIVAYAAVETIADVDNQVRGSLDDLKDNLFRLELRRQAGTISEEDYARERARVEKALRDLVRG